MGDEAIQVKLNENKFQTTLFKPTSWQKKIDFINRLILKNNILISVVGKEKSGKTTYANFLQTSLSPRIKTHIITAHSIFNHRIFLQQIGLTLNISGEPSFSNFISYINDRKEKILLIIDDAHFLSLEFIEIILNGLASQGSNAYFHVCLISDYSMLSKLKHLTATNYQDMVHSIDLGPLTESETKSYLVEQFLKISGTDKLISEDKLKQFYSLTDGCLLQMNRQFSNFFSGLEKIASQPVRHDKTFNQATAGICLLLVAFGIGALYKRPIPNHETTKQETKVLIPIETPDLAISSFIPAYFDMSKQHLLVPATVKKAEYVVRDQKEVLISVIPVIDKVLVAPKEIAKPFETKIAITKENTNRKENKPSKEIAKTKSIKPSKKLAKEYTIQLMGSFDKRSLIEFSEQYKIKGKIWIVHRKGQKNWYVFTVGQFKENYTARLAMSKLPKSINRLSPWVRAIENMQETA